MANRAFMPPQSSLRLVRLARQHPLVALVLVLEVVWWCTLGGIISDFVETFRLMRELERIKRERDRAAWEHYCRTHPAVRRRLSQKLFPIRSNHTRP